ncbi:MAG: Ig-like domain-containing protein [Oscillospiraceae bacterium]|nr:Ig-like domain-containing protein [Oscillospiraceae bacterium]
MSDILCDVCGTSYPETDTQCPICGTAKSDSATVEGLNSQETTGYAYVRGGRFSQSNVRKRNGGKEPARVVAPVKPAKETPPAEPVKPKKAKKEKAQPPVVQEPAVVPVETPAPQPVYQQPQQIYQAPQPVYQQPYQAPQPVYSQPDAPRRKKQNKKKGSVIGNVILLVIVILLVAAIVAACAYLAIKLARMYVDPAAFGGTTTSQTSPSNSSSTNRPADILCSEIQLSIPSYTFTSIGQTLLLQVTKLPANTTEQVTFESSDPYIASVDAEGRVVAVAKGTAVITVRCGQAEAKTCEIVCNLPNDPAYPTQPPATTIPTTSATKPFVELVLNRTDFTLVGYGSTHNLYSGPLDPAAITWTSSNENVAKVENGIVTAVGNGMAVITAKYEDQEVTCDVHCREVVKNGGFRLSTSDTTIKVGESFTLRAYLTDENGEYVLDEDGKKIQIDASELKFYVTDAEGFLSVDEYGKVTAIKNNRDYLEKYKYVYVEYNGIVLKCIVRVKDAS